MTEIFEKRVLDAIFISTVILLSASAYIFTIPQPSRPIFPLWILGEDRMILSARMNVTVGNEQHFFIGAQNKMGKLQYCDVLVKFRNMSLPVPSTANVTSSPLSSIVNFRFFLMNGELWEKAFKFKILGTENITENRFTVQALEINDQRYDVFLDALWDTNSTGFYYQFFFELWLFDEKQEKFSYSGVWISSPFLNVTE